MKLEKTTKPLDIPFGDQTLHVVYYVDAVTLEIVIDGPDGSDDRQSAKYIATVVEMYLQAWDLEDDAGPVGTTFADLIHQPARLIRAVFDAINKDGSPGEATGSN